MPGRRSSWLSVLFVSLLLFSFLFLFFFFNDTATTEIYTLSLHDALPIWSGTPRFRRGRCRSRVARWRRSEEHTSELQSRGLISYAVFCLKKKKTQLRRMCAAPSDTTRTQPRAGRRA